MKVRELIDALQRNYAPDEAIVVAWWDKEHFDAAENLSTEEWAQAAEYMDEMDWSYTHDALEYTLNEYLRMGES
jgi:hypothetical protein